MHLAKRMSLRYSMKPPERTISNSSFIMLATTSLRLLSKRRQNFSKICGGRTPLEDFWWAVKPSADLRLAKRNHTLHRPPRLRASAIPCIRLRQSGATRRGAGFSA